MMNGVGRGESSGRGSGEREGNVGRVDGAAGGGDAGKKGRYKLRLRDPMVPYVEPNPDALLWVRGSDDQPIPNKPYITFYMLKGKIEPEDIYYDEENPDEFFNAVNYDPFVRPPLKMPAGVGQMQMEIDPTPAPEKDKNQDLEQDKPSEKKVIENGTVANDNTAQEKTAESSTETPAPENDKNQDLEQDKPSENKLTENGNVADNNTEQDKMDESSTETTAQEKINESSTETTAQEKINESSTETTAQEKINESSTETTAPEKDKNQDLEQDKPSEKKLTENGNVADDNMAEEKTAESSSETATTEDNETGKSTEEGNSKPDVGENDAKGKEKEDESDSDDDKPQISIRNFAEITERDSDDEEDIQEIILDQGAPIATAPISYEPTIKTYSSRDRAKARLLEIATHDSNMANLDMTIDTDVQTTTTQRIQKNRDLHRGCMKLAKFLKRQMSKNEKPESRSNLPASTSTQIRGVVESSRQTRSSLPRDSAASVMSSMMQSVQQTYQSPSMSASQLVYGRGTAASTTRPRQQVPPLSLISGANTFAPGTTIIAQPVTSLWQQPGQQVLQRPTNVGNMQVRNSTTVTSVSSGPRPAVVNNNVNVQQPFTQLIYDPSTGFLLCPTNQNLMPQQQNAGQQQRVMQQPTNTLRLQNGMLIRPNDPSFNSSVRQVLGNRNGLEISLNTVPQINTQQGMQFQQQRPTAPVRPFAPVQRQQVSSRLTRPQQASMNTPVMHQSILNSQQRNRSPVPVPQRGPSPRFNAIRPTAPQVQRTVAPQIQRPTIRPNVGPRVNGMPLPVAHTIKTTGPVASTAPPDLSNVTAGNQKPIPGTVEEAENDLQNKTFPSLVVQVKTCLSTKPNRQLQTKARSDLDAGVKAVLVHTPAKFTEWLMRRGLLKLAHYCDVHANQSFKLGMYSDGSRQPFSGGYVWTSDCCPDRQISVFSGSIFEGSKYPPGTVLKLMYHWSCQTPANNILQWVKVSSLYLKNFFTLLRAVCISWMHEQCPPMGGESKYVEIGVITLGSSAETSRGVKNVNVEILGVFDPNTKIIRMKVINSMQGQLFKDKNKGGKPDAYEQGARAFQILWPLTHWVDKRSVLLVDGIIDRALFQELGFKNIQLCNDSQRNTVSNSNVMNYLRNLVPKMFSSTLSVLSKSIVQQFLDELSWREMYGQTVLTCFENLLDHIGTMTKWDLRGESLITRLNKINQNPFVDWSYTKQTRRCPLNTVPLSLRNEPGIRECVRHVMKDEKKQPPPPPVYNPNPSPAYAPPASSYAAPQKSAAKRKNVDSRDVVANIAYYKEVFETSPKTHSLQSFYYGSVRADDNPSAAAQRFPPNIKCPMCTRTFTTNVEICRHIYTHISSVTYRGSENSVCKVCLKELPMGVSMNQHMHIAHIMVGCNTACRICEEKFKTEQELVIHMWDLHQRRETPYKCTLCNYASSFHYYAVQHHQEKHAAEPDVMCPFCLKIFSCASVSQLKLLINHLQAHAHLLRRPKKCPRCVLSFVSDVDLEVHLQEHRSQEPSAKWIPYLLPPNETNVKMATPPPTKTPLQVSIMAASAAALASAAPPAKKQKLNQYPAKKKQSTLNATLAVPIDTNEKFGGSKYKINIPSTAKGSCGECGEDITSPNHFIGKLICCKCRYSTACQAAMELHHTRNHQPGSKSIKPGMKTNKVKSLEEQMFCKCGFSSTHPYQLANHLISCDKTTIYPKTRVAPPSSESSVVDPPPKSPLKEPAPTLPDTSLADVPLSPTLGLLGREPVTTFDDMLSLEESMASTLDALALPPLLSPSAPMPQSPPLSVFEAAANSSATNAPSVSQAPSSSNNLDANSTWDTDAWEIPGLIAKCKQSKSKR